MSLEDKLDKVSTLLETNIMLMEKVLKKMEERDTFLSKGESCLTSIDGLLRGAIPLPIRIPGIHTLTLEEDTSNTQFD